MFMISWDFRDKITQIRDVNGTSQLTPNTADFIR